MGHFDNIGAALLLLFESATMEGWPDVMWATIDSYSEPGHAPVRNYRMINGVYMLLWILLGGMFLINVFVGVIVESFDKIRKETDQSATMTVEQQQWVDAMKAMTKQEPTRGVKQWQEGYGPCRIVFNIVNSPTFDGFITAVIVGNIGLMAGDGSVMTPPRAEPGGARCAVRSLVPCPLPGCGVETETALRELLRLRACCTVVRRVLSCKHSTPAPQSLHSSTASRPIDSRNRRILHRLHQYTVIWHHSSRKTERAPVSVVRI